MNNGRLLQHSGSSEFADRPNARPVSTWFQRHKANEEAFASLCDLLLRGVFTRTSSALSCFGAQPEVSNRRFAQAMKTILHRRVRPDDSFARFTSRRIHNARSKDSALLTSALIALLIRTECPSLRVQGARIRPSQSQLNCIIPPIPALPTRTHNSVCCESQSCQYSEGYESNDYSSATPRVPLNIRGAVPLATDFVAALSGAVSGSILYVTIAAVARFSGKTAPK